MRWIEWKVTTIILLYIIIIYISILTFDMISITFVTKAQFEMFTLIFMIEI